MFESLSDRLGASLKAISGKSKLTEDNIRDTLRDVRMTLLEADVALPVVGVVTPWRRGGPADARVSAAEMRQGPKTLTT